MSRTIIQRPHRATLRRIAPAILLTIGLAACATDTTGTSDEGASPVASEASSESAVDEVAAFPVTVTDDVGEHTIEAAPSAIVSMSPSSTEMLFAIGAGDQVVATDSYSNFPEEAPVTDLSAFTPNVEAILAYQPDLVVLSGDSNDVVAGLDAAGVTVLQFGAASDLETAFAQFRALGLATGHDAEAAVNDIEKNLADIAASTDVEPGLTYYHELSSDLYSATTSTFIGEIYGLFGMVNIADAADADGFGYPQLSAEYIVEQDPDFVFLACTVFCEETAETFGARDAFSGLTAVAEGNVVELNDDVVSRWGPRMVEFAEQVAAAVSGG